MPEIPYSGVPDRTPELRPTPSLNVNPPEAAFGTTIAAATQHLGQVEEGAGKELFDRAYALQEMHVQSDALQKGSATRGGGDRGGVMGGWGGCGRAAAERGGAPRAAGVHESRVSALYGQKSRFRRVPLAPQRLVKSKIS